MVVSEVSSEQELNSSLADNVTISIEADIYLTFTVEINTIAGLVIEGNGFKIDGQQNISCMKIANSSIALNNLTIINGINVTNIYCILPNYDSINIFRSAGPSRIQIICYYNAAGAGIIVQSSILTMTSCTIANNTAVRANSPPSPFQFFSNSLIYGCFIIFQQN